MTATVPDMAERGPELERSTPAKTLRGWSSRQFLRYDLVRNGVVAVGLLCVLVALDAPLLDMPHFWDSMTFVAGAHFVLTNGFSPILPTSDDYGHPVLLLEILALAWQLFGESLKVAHLVMLLFALVTLYGTYLVGQALYSWRTGLLAATLLLFYPLFRTQSILVLLDLPTAAFSVLAIYGLVQRNTTWFIISASAMVLTKATGIVLIPAALLYVFLSRRRTSSPEALVVSLVLHSIPLFVLGGWFWFHWQATGWISVSDNLGWLALPDDAAPSTFFLDYVPRMVLSREGIVATFALAAISDFVTRFMVGILTLFIIANSVSIQSIRPLRFGPKALPCRTANIASVCQAWGGSGNLVLIGVPIVLQLGLMAFTTSLHRYLLPEYPLFFVAAAYALGKVLNQKRLIAGVLLATLVIFSIGWAKPWFGSSLSSPSNAAYLDFVDLDRQASAFLEAHYPNKIVLAGWPQYVLLAVPAQGYVVRPLQVLAPIGTQERQQARLQALGGRSFTDPTALGGEDFDVLYYSARSNPPDAEILRTLVQRFDLKRIVEFSRNADYVAIYAAKNVDGIYQTSVCC